MEWDVIEANVIGPLEFEVEFADGLTGNVILKETHLKGVFQPLADPDFFRQIQVSNGFVTWPGEIDLAPDAMHEAIEKNGNWILD